MYVDAGLDNGDGLYGGRGFERGATQNGIFDSDGLGSIVYGAYTLTGGNGMLSRVDGNRQVFESPGFNCNDVATVR